MSVGLLCQATTRTETVEIAVNIQLQQISRVVGRSSRGRGLSPPKAERRKVEMVDTGIDESDGMLFGHGVVAPLWEQELCVAVRAVDKAQAGIKLQESQEVSRGSEQCYSLPKHCVFTQSGAAPAASVKTLPQALYKASCQQGKRCSTRHLPAC